MQLDGLERHRAGDGPIHRLDSRLKLIATVGFVVVVITTPLGYWRVFGAEGLFLAFAIGLAGIPPRELARRWLGLFVLVAFLTAMVAPAHPLRAQYGLTVVASSILIKNGLALVAMLVLTGTTPFPSLLTALRKLGVPAVLVATLQFMDRYRYVFLDELERMATARRRACSGAAGLSPGACSVG